MSKYTTELRFICERYAGLDESTGGNTVSQVVELARPLLFNFDYPIFDEDYKAPLETKIIRHFYTREICAETVGLWKMWLENKLNEIMPYYNELYKSATLEYNPLYDTDYTVDHTGGDTSQGSSSNTSGGSDTSTGTDSKNYSRADKFSQWNLYSDTPQGGINGISGAEDDPALGTNGYLTNATHILHDGTGSTGSDTGNRSNTTNYGRTDNGTTNITSTNQFIEKVTGKRGGASYSSLIKEYRKNLLNIDMMIIDELNELFFNLW